MLKTIENVISYKKERFKIDYKKYIEFINKGNYSKNLKNNFFYTNS